MRQRSPGPRDREELEDGLAFSAASRGDDLVIDLRGALDEETAPRLWASLEIEIGQGPPRVVLDLSKLDFISSAGIRVVVQCMRRLQSYGAELVVRSPNRTAERVLEVTGVAQLVTIEHAGS